MNALKLLLFAVPLISLPALAEEEKEPEGTVEARHEKKEAWEEHPHFFTGFGGVTLGSGEAPGDEETATIEATPTFGIDYSFRFSKYFAVGAYFDYALNFRELLVGPCLFFFPWKGLFFEASPSLQIEHNEEIAFAARLAAGYEFELTEQFLLGVYAAVDYGHARFAFVPGVTIGYGF